ARQQLKKGAGQDARSALCQVLAIKPGDPEANRLWESMDAQNKTQDREAAKISGLIGRIHAAINRNLWFPPDTDNGMELISQLEPLNKDNKLGNVMQSYREQVKRASLAQVRTYMTNNQWDQAMGLLAKHQKAFPQDTEAVQLKTTAESQ